MPPGHRESPAISTICPSSKASSPSLLKAASISFTPSAIFASQCYFIIQEYQLLPVRLTTESRLLRVGRGSYVAPISSRFGTRAPAPQKVVDALAAQSGAAVSALAWIGPAHVSESVATLHRTLPTAEWRVLASSRAALPSWMAQAIDAEAARV